MPAKKGQQYRHLPAFILLVLAEGPVHGGGIHAALAGKLPLFQADTGAVYRTLQRLEKDGEVASTWDTAGPGPARKLYHLTAAGWDKLDYWRRDIELRLANLNYFLDTYRRLRTVARNINEKR